MKRNPEKILNSLTQHSSDLDYKFERLYRILFNDEMYYIAYQRIYAKQGNMTKGVDGKTIDGFSISHVERLIDALKDETYQPKPSQRDRKSTRLNSSHANISYAVFCLKKKK